MKLLIARLPPLPIEVARHLEGAAIRGASAFALGEPVVRIVIVVTPWTRRIQDTGGAIPLEARIFGVLVFNVDAVAIHVVCDKPPTTDVALDMYRVRITAAINALAMCCDIVWIPPIGQFRASLDAVNNPIYVIVVFVGVGAGSDTDVVIEVPAPAVGPAMVITHPVQILAPTKRDHQTG